MRLAKRWRGIAILALLALALLGVGVAVCLCARLALANRTIAGLRAGRDLSVAAAAPFAAKQARALFLLRHERLEDAQHWVDEIGGSGSRSERAALFYNLANARLRNAFALIEQSKIDAAAANVRLAKDGYRRALALEPEFWDAKYNLDVAMRLVRDFPQMEATVLEPPPRELPKRLWTELPRAPRGLP